MEVNLFAKAAVKFLVGFAIFCALWAVVLLLLFQLFPDHQDVIALSWVVGVFVSYLPWFILTTNATAKGEGRAVSIDDIKDAIETINTYDVPVIVEKKNANKYVLTWRYADKKWQSIMSKSGMTHSYKLIVKLNDEKKRATLIDIQRSIRWGVGPTGFKIGGRYFRGISARFKKGARWGIRENFELTKIDDYKFQASEIKDPVVNTLLRNGWDVRFGLF